MFRDSEASGACIVSIVGDGHGDIDLIACRYFQRSTRLHGERQTRSEDLARRTKPAVQRVRERRHLESAQGIAQVERDFCLSVWKH